MKKPIVAVTADVILTEMKIQNQRKADYAPRPLMDALGRNGFLPIILAYSDYADPEDFADTFDALVIPGGVNPSPRFYGEEPVWSLGPTFVKRDIFEIGLIKACIKRNKPILGICRGMQLINVTLGGTLWQDMSYQNPKAFFIQHMQRGPADLTTHSITIEKGSRLYDIFGEEIFVNSIHKESIKKLAPALTATAHARDGVIEAVEGKDSDLITGVQWHPENMDPKTMDPLFQAFKERVIKHMA